MGSDLGSIMTVITLILSTLFAWNLIQPAESRYPLILVDISVGSKEAVMQQGGESTVYNTKKQMDVILIANPALLRDRGISPASSPAAHATELAMAPAYLLSAADAHAPEAGASEPSPGK